MSIDRHSHGWRQTACSGWALVIGALAIAGCGPRGNDTDLLTRVPGTERIIGATGTMHVSPDERWIVSLVSASDESPSYPVYGLVSIELATGRHVEHHLDLVPEPKRGGPREEWYLAVSANYGRDTGWFEDRLYATAGMEYLVVDNNEPAITLGKPPKGKLPNDNRSIALGKPPKGKLPSDTRLMVSDGPEWGTWEFELNRRLEGIRRVNDRFDVLGYAAAWRGSHYAATTYWFDQESNMIVAGRPGRESRPIAKKPRGGVFTEAAVTELRVSPDESYLAYIVWYSNRYIPSPFIWDDVHVVDLKTGRKRVVCSFRLAGNMQWSPDGKRLYLSGDNRDGSPGVFIVDVAKAFR